MIAIATALSTLFGLFSAEAKTPTDEPSCRCGASCSNDNGGDRARSQLNSTTGPIYVSAMGSDQWERGFFEMTQRWTE